VGDKLKKFIDLFAKEAANRVEIASTNLETYKKAKAEALKFTTPVNATYPTLGSLIKDLFPEAGGVDNSLFRDLYTSLLLDKEDKSAVSSLFKIKDAPIQYKNELAIQNLGGEAYFNSVMRSIGSELIKADLKFDKLVESVKVGKPDGDLAEFIEDAIGKSGGHYLGKILNSAEFYDALLENGDPVGKKEAKPTSPVNQPIEQVKEKTKAPINEFEPVAKPITQSSAVNPEKGETSNQTEVSTLTGSVTTTPVKLPTESTVPESGTTVNLNLESKETPAISSPINTSQSNVSNVVNNSSTITSNALNSIKNVEGNTTKENTESATTNNSINSKSESSDKQSYREIRDAMAYLEKITKTSTTNNTLNSKTNKKEKSVEKVSANTETSPINEESKESEELVDSNELAQAKFDALTNYVNQYDKMNKEESTEVKSEAIPTLQPKSKDMTEVVKTAPSIPNKPASQIKEKESTTSLNTSETSNNTGVSMVEKNTESRSTVTDKVTESSNSTAAPQSINIDMSEVAHRLARLEHVLTGTLEVKIVES